jgi:hypothetical protein
MLHEKVVCRAPPSKRDWPASTNSLRTAVPLVGLAGRPASSVVERHRTAEHLARWLHEVGAGPPAEARSVLRLTMRATVFASGLAYGSVTKMREQHLDFLPTATLPSSPSRQNQR